LSFSAEDASFMERNMKIVKPEQDDATLDDAARSEREYVRGRLREELKREPTEPEVDEWLRQHTEGY
jgi:hypothetical protein